ncbi:Sphinganine C(4)-monooxygenase 1 [Platanthera zijinensis]|uniref:aldehyde oxygenase (deformylating) n=1 Tax=Platanthera zijinensis TaxID=2320716 RepID=A0AAP0BU73_9ASPA
MAIDLATLKEYLLPTLVPIVVYWIYSGIYYFIFEHFDDYRLHTKEEEDAKNKAISKGTVAKGVLLCQFIQFSLSFLVLLIKRKEGELVPAPQPQMHVIFLQIFIGIAVMDTWQYFAHRTLHTNEFLYKHVHSWHHKVVASYGFGALYTHPIEGLITDTGGGILTYLISGMSPRTAMFFMSYATIKAIDDHSGMWLPGNILHFFENNSAYHDIHHQPYGLKYNYSNLFFVNWDRLLGTYMPYTVEERKNGRGFAARPAHRKTT